MNCWLPDREVLTGLYILVCAAFVCGVSLGYMVRR